MYKGHYTERDLSNFSEEKDKWASAVLAEENLEIWSNGLDITFTKLQNRERKNYKRVKNIPEKYRTVAELIRKKASKHGGHRLGAGRKKTAESGLRVPRTIRMTDYEYRKVVGFLATLRQSR
jgi:hypothetical protein